MNFHDTLRFLRSVSQIEASWHFVPFLQTITNPSVALCAPFIHFVPLWWTAQRMKLR